MFFYLHMSYNIFLRIVFFTMTKEFFNIVRNLTLVGTFGLFNSSILRSAVSVYRVSINSFMFKLLVVMGTAVADMTKIQGLSQAQTWIENDHCFVNGAHAFVLKVSSFFGVAPLRFKSHENGYTVSVSKPMCIYSYILITFLVAITYYGTMTEMFLGISPFLHNSSHLSQAMSVCDISFLVLVGGAGVYGAPARMRTAVKFMSSIALVDKIIGPKYNRVKERWLSAGFLIFMAFLTLIVIIDIYFSTIKASSDRKWVLVLHYLGFYLFWYFVIILEVQFAVTAMLVYERFRTLNESLSLTANYVCKPMAVEPRLSISPTDAVHRNALIYSKLCDVVRHLESSYSTCLVIILVSTLFHLIITPYFAIAEINVRASGNLFQFIILQMMWCGLHLIRLLMVVEPCHYTTTEVNKTERLVCRMMLSSPAKSAMAFQLDLLSRQLMLQPISYRPMGTCTLGRPLIASIFGAVTTYLVILVQFQKYES